MIRRDRQSQARARSATASRPRREAPRFPLWMALLAASTMVVAVPLSAQQDTVTNGDRTSVRDTAVPTLAAVRVQDAPPVIDGDLSDPVWATAPVAGDFVQFTPSPGEPASERTEARVLYDDEAIYVAIRAWDSNPEQIAAQLTRRDESSYSDRVHVIIDSYHDRRTAFQFSVNPLGVKMDLYRYNDTAEDLGWNAVWDVATQIDDEGWTAEFRIPLSQLRFSSSQDQTWGINFARDIARRNEMVTWAPISPQEQAIVSRSGELQGLTGLTGGRRVELLPYTVTRATRAPGDPANPFYSRTDTGVEVGADLKIGITNNLTLDMTLNPDFGQVEADPARVNLTAFETFLPEQRPFFLEGAGIFRFGIGIGDGDGGNETLFYSRRIGRAPQGGFAPQGAWVDRPSQTRILGAGKLSGKTETGWSVGVLSALTGSEQARSAHPDGERDARTVEPLTNYSMARVQRDFRGGSSAVGVIGTATVRDADPAEALGLRERAVTGGVDFRHRFRSNTLEVSGSVLGSRVAGSEESILRTQLSSARYFQRPDNDHTTLDPTRTHLSGASGSLELMKVGGGPWVFGTITQARSPGFEVNDLGFMTGTDYIVQAGFLGYRQTQPGRHLRNWGLNTSLWSGWTTGGEHTDLAGNVNGNLTLNNNWSAFAGMNLNGSALSPTLLRGGPMFRTEPGANGWMGVNSDSRRALQVGSNMNWGVRPESDSWNANVSTSMRWRPSGRTTVRLSPFHNRRIEDRQWLGRMGGDDDPHYLFGRLEQSTTGVTARLDLAISPTLSLQFYGQPFHSSGHFSELRVVEDPRADRYEDRLRVVQTQRDDQNRMVGDVTGDGQSETLGNPDFSVGQFRSNAVLRWEYRPGSTLFVVWSQARDHQGVDGSVRAGDGFSELFGRQPENVLMLKLNYWLNP